MKNSRLEEIRQELGLKKSDFAALLGVSPNYYYNILKGDGTSNLRLEHLENLLVQQGVSPIWVMTGQGEKYFNLKTRIDEQVAGHIIPDVSNNTETDSQKLEYLVSVIISNSHLPIISSDWAYQICVHYCKRYMSKYPDAKLEESSISALTEGFLVLLETAQQIVNTAVSSTDEVVVVEYDGRHYNFHKKPVGNT